MKSIILSILVFPFYIFGQEISKEFEFDTPPVAIGKKDILKKAGYPKVIRQLYIDGTIYFRVYVDEYGKYLAHERIICVIPILNSLIEPYLSQLSFTPAKLNDKNVSGWVDLRFRFDLLVGGWFSRTHSKGLVFMESGNFEEAFGQLEKTLDDYETVDSVEHFHFEPHCLIMLGICCINLNQLEKAEKYLNMASILIDSTNRMYEELEATIKSIPEKEKASNSIFWKYEAEWLKTLRVENLKTRILVKEILEKMPY